MKIKVDTAVQVAVNVVSLIDDTDFKSREVALTYDQAGMDLVWNFQTPDGAITQTAVTPTTGGDYDWAHLGDGMYKIEIPASGGASINNDTEGNGWFTGVCTGVLPWSGPVYEFVPANVSDSLVKGTDTLDVQVSGMDADVITAAALAASAGAEIAALVETYIVNEGDATAVMQAIADVIAADWVAGDASPLAIASAVWVNAARTLTDKAGFSLAADQSGVTVGTVATLTNWHASVTDWTDGGRLDLILDSIQVDVAGLDGDAMRGTDNANTTVPDAAGTAAALHATTDGLVGTGNAILAKFDTMVVLDGAVYDFTAAALAAGPTGSSLDAAATRAAIGLAAANLDTQLGTVANTGADGDTLETLSDQIDTLAALSGEDAYTGVLTVDDGAGTNLEGAVVNMRRGGVLKASGTTGSSGTITDWVCGAYTYDLAVRLDGYQPATDTMAISADAWTKTVSLTALSITPSADPATTTAYWVVKKADRTTAAANEAVMYLKIVTPPTTDGLAWSEEVSSAEPTDASGICAFENVPKGCKVAVRLGTDGDDWKHVDIPSDAGTTYAAGEITGKIVASS